MAEELVTELAYSYKLLLVEQSRRLFGLASSGRAILPVIRAMQLLARRLALGYRMYATNAKGVWLELHELYQFALRRGLANRSLPDEADTPLRIYRDALLVAFAEPLKLMQGDLDRLYAWLGGFGTLAALSGAGQTRGGQGMFLIKPQRDVPGYALAKRHHPIPHGNDFVLNTLSLADALLDQLRASPRARARNRSACRRMRTIRHSATCSAGSCGTGVRCRTAGSRGCAPMRAWRCRSASAESGTSCTSAPRRRAPVNGW
ncbi:MAG: hypothetical protein M5U08_16610 [Burkholderiales bacterium]|nr:hypothetical protein [Burkholderiales bacterium]